MYEFISQHSVEIAIGIGALLAFLVSYFNQRANNKVDGQKVSSEVIAAYAEQVKQFKEKVGEYEKTVHELTLRLGEQNGIIKEKDRQIEEYRQIFQNRNPDLVKTLGAIEKFMKNVDDMLKGINERSLSREKRDAAVDEGHVKAMTELNNQF